MAGSLINCPTLADAIFDRLENTAYRIQFDGLSIREREARFQRMRRPTAVLDAERTEHTVPRTVLVRRSRAPVAPDHDHPPKQRGVSIALDALELQAVVLKHRAQH